MKGKKDKRKIKTVNFGWIVAGGEMIPVINRNSFESIEMEKDGCKIIVSVKEGENQIVVSKKSMEYTREMNRRKLKKLEEIFSF